MSSSSLPLHYVLFCRGKLQWSNCGGTQGNGVPLPFLAGNAVPLAYTTAVSIGVTLNHAMHYVICSGLGSLECFVIIKSTKFGQLIRRNIIKIVATRCLILWLKCTKFDFGWGSVPDHAGELTVLPQTTSWI